MNLNSDVINKLLEVAQKSFDNGEIPVAACILDSDGNVLSMCGNTRQSNCSVIDHAEIKAITETEKSINDWRLNGYFLISTLEPCDMCCSVIVESRLDSVYYLIPRNGDSIYSNSNINKSLIPGYEKEKEKLQKLLTTFFENRR